MNKWYLDSGPEPDVVVSSRTRLARNIKGFPFPNRIDALKQLEISKKVIKAFFSTNAEIGDYFDYFNINSFDPISKLQLFESHIISKEIIENGYESGIILSKDEQISIMINEEDHLRIQCMAPGMQLDKVWDICKGIDELFEEKIDFAFNANIGYITCCPTNAGTALRASVMLHLPALTMTGYMHTVLKACGKLNIAVRGLYGENTEASGNMYQISNQVTLGKSEEDIIQNIQYLTKQIIDQERALRNDLIERKRDKIEDKIYRSLGILQSARIISLSESLKRLSDIRLGSVLNMFEDIDLNIINKLNILTHDGYLQKLMGGPIIREQRNIKRAELIRNALNTNEIKTN